MAQSVRPRNRKEFMNKLIEPYSKEYGNPNEVFTEPFKDGQPEINRAHEITLKDDLDKDFSIGIKDIDEAVMYYFNNVLKLSVVQNNGRLTVPVIYGTPANWKSVQADGYYRDSNGKLLAPLLMFRRNSVTQNRNLGNKLDGNVSRNLQLFEKSYNRRNVYTNFGLLNNRSLQKEYVMCITPDYVTIEYTCMMWTYFVEQMDKLIEAVNFSSRAYWGDPTKFKFYSDIESFTDTITYDVGDDRAVMSEFTIKLNGYLIPKSVNAEIASANRVYGASKVVFGMEVSNTSEEFSVSQNKPVAKSVGSVIAADSVNKIINVNNYNSFDPVVTTYLNTNKEVQGTYQSETTFRFTNWIIAPTVLPATSIDNFIFSCNGQLIEKSSISSFTESGGYSYLVINPASLGYSFEADDVVVSMGKFV
jgi:hypothetical protein